VNDEALLRTAPGTKPVYVPPAVDSDAPLDPIEQALVRALVRIVVRELRQKATAAEARELLQYQTDRPCPSR
jgi:hypothetical protein